MRDAHVGAELSTAGQMRKGHTERRRRCGHTFGNDRRADYAWDDEHVVACANPAVGSKESVEARRAHDFEPALSRALVPVGPLTRTH